MQYYRFLCDGENMEGRPFSEICQELALSAEQKGETVLAALLRMAALDAVESGVRQEAGRTADLLVGVWDWDVVQDRVYADTRFASMFGISSADATLGSPIGAWLRAVYPGDRTGLQEAIQDALRGGAFAIEYRVIVGGAVRWLYARGKCTLDADGRPVRFPGAVVDITHEKTDQHAISIVPN
ncbi:PAS domain-containing protein [Tardiphaga sp.]|uniref:PAS domain-containing protein n=1 Tax=Tardiphaga sp. TaxID=1926292 RepID=UPI0037D9AD70